MHQSHENIWHIGHPKWHYEPLKQSFLGLECGLLFISGSNADLVVAAPQINLGKDHGPAQIV